MYDENSVATKARKIKSYTKKTYKTLVFSWRFAIAFLLTVKRPTDDKKTLCVTKSATNSLILTIYLVFYYFWLSPAKTKESLPNLNFTFYAESFYLCKS